MATISNTNYFSPTQISGCALWLDAADANSITLNGNNVSQWNDKSGNARNAIQATAINQPSYSSNAVIFGLSTFLTTSVTASANTETVFMVTLLSNTTYTSAILGQATGSSGGRQFEVAYTANATSCTARLIRMNQIYVNVAAVPQSPTSISLAEYTNNGTTSIIYWNGASINTSVTPSAFSGSFTTAIGTRGATLLDQFFNGRLYEILIYSNVLLTAQRQQIEGYLAWKWGTQASLPTTHPYYFNPMIPNLSLPAPLRNPLTTANTTLITMNPTQISGCALWLDAADSSSVVLSGSNVTQWNDKSGSNINMIYDVGNVTYNRTGFNNNPTITLGPGRSGFTYNSNLNLSATNSLSFYLVLRPTTSSGNIRILSFFAGGVDYTPPGFGISLQNPTSTDHKMAFGRGTPYAGFNPLNVYNTNIFTSIIFNGNLSTNPAVPLSNTGIGINGNTFANFTGYSIGTNFSTYNPFRIGEWSVATNDIFNGNISEIIMFNRALNTNENQQIEGYLAWKWGTQSNLPTSHPYYYNPLIPNLVLQSQLLSMTPTFLNPSRFTGLSLWLDAADANTITQSGGSVTRWNDKSGNGRNATTVNSIQYIIDSQNRNAIYINNSQSFNIPSFAPSATSQISVFCVINQLQTVGAGNVDMIRTSSYANFTMNLAISTNNYGVYVNSASGTSATTFSVNNRVTICEIVFNVSSGNTFVNGSTTTTFSAAAGTALTTSQTLVIGGNTTINMNYYELLFYSTTLTTTQRQQIEGYLAWKWGLQSNLPANHPYVLFPPN